MKSLRRPLSSINHQAAEMVLHFRLMLLHVSKRPVEPFFFSGEKDKANRAPRALARAHDGLCGSKRRRGSRTVVGGSFAEIPGIEMSTDYENFFRMLAPANFPDHVGCIHRAVGKRILHVEADARRHP